MSQSKLSAVSTLYANYAAKLFGYIFEVVKNQSVAEQYLVAVFNDVPNEIDDFLKTGANALCRLQMMARKKLSEFFETLDNETDKQALQNLQPLANNKYVAMMSPLQQQVFYAIHYRGHTIAQVAAELSKSNEEVKKVLKQCFTIIRNGRDNERLHR
ncbi:sigma factor-like helix-turn-helix DNA-binding protein [Mucilaginibacter oryzae]|nr:sigma factor-like helix-turn-helix DNA-binding protein [Mucilaginibacter oryzae]